MGVDTEDEESDDGVCKYALDGVHIEEGIDAMSCHLTQAGVGVLWH